jgi:sulfate adenylyltransferase subunit 1 (EFTu-like GTPase family)
MDLVDFRQCEYGLAESPFRTWLNAMGIKQEQKLPITKH